MAPQLYLITPATAAPDSFPATLMAVLSAAEFSALLVQRGSMDDAAYAALAAAVINIGQGAGCAVLLDNEPELAKRLGADGVHVTGDAKAIKHAIALLKPNAIVGAGNLTSRHDAMTAGEMDVDYVFFGPLSGPSDDSAAELANWWSQTFEVPAVLSDPAATAASFDPAGAEFLALSTSIWNDGPDVARAIAQALRETA